VSHHLAVDGGLRLFEAPRPRVDVIHDKTAHLALVGIVYVGFRV
jgi:hypothetical protein